MKCYALRYLFFLFTCFLWHANIYGQHTEIIVKGTVMDTSGQALKSATVAIYKDKVLQKQVVSTDKGFQLGSLAPGKYTLVTSFAGYLTDTLRITVTPNDPIVNVGQIRMKTRAVTLKEVEVVSEGPAVTIKGDTVVYNAAAFKTPPNSTVEELIKVLPGLEVDRDGGITYQGKRIQYISINGKQYFLNDQKLISKNLFSDMINKVELFDVASKESKLTGIKDPNPGKALNLVTKKGMRLDINGKIYAGATQKGDYTAGASASSFIDDRAVFASLNANNLSDLYTGADKLEDMSAGGRGKLSSVGGTISYGDKWSPALSVNLNPGIRHDNSKILSRQNHQTFYGDSTQLRLDNNYSTNIGYGYSLNGEILLRLDSLETGNISYKPTINIGRNTTRSTSSFDQYIQHVGSQYLNNTGTTNNTSIDQNASIENELFFSKRLKKRTLQFNFLQNYYKSNSDGFLNSDTKSYNNEGALLLDNQIKQQFKQTTLNSNYNIGVTDYEQISQAQSLSLTYQISKNQDDAKRESYDFNTATNKYDLLNTLTTNNFKNINTTQSLSAGYSYTQGNISFRIGGGLQNVTLESSDFIKDNSFKKDFLNWTGNTFLLYKLGNNKTDPKKKLTPAEMMKAFINASRKEITISYNISNQSPSAMELVAFTDLSDPLFIRTGNPNLKPEQDHVLNINYNMVNPKKGKSFKLNLTGKYRKDPIVTTTDLLPSGVQQSGYVNSSGLYDASASAAFEFPMVNIKNGKIRFTNAIGYLQDMGLVNGEKNTREGVNVGQQFEVSYRKGIKWDARINGAWKYDNSHFTLQPERNTTSFTHYYTLILSYSMPWKVRLSSYYRINFYGAQAGLPARNNMLWNAGIMKNVFKNNRGEFRFMAFDMLNGNNGISQGANGKSIYRIETNTPGRQFLLTFAYYFRPKQQQ